MFDDARLVFEIFLSRWKNYSTMEKERNDSLKTGQGENSRALCRFARFHFFHYSTTRYITSRATNGDEQTTKQFYRDYWLVVIGIARLKPDTWVSFN